MIKFINELFLCFKKLLKSKMLSFSIFLCFILIFHCKFSNLSAMMADSISEPNYNGVFTRKIYDQRDLLNSQEASQLSGQEIAASCVRTLRLNKERELGESLIQRMRKKIEILKEESDNDRKRVFWDTLIGNTSVLPFALMGCKCPHEFVIAAVATVVKTIASGVVSKFYDPPMVAALTKEIKLIEEEVKFLFEGLEKEKVYEHEIQYVKKKRKLNPILQTEIEDALIEARNPTVIYPILHTFLKYSILLPTAPKRLLGNNPQEEFLTLKGKFEEDRFFGGFPKKTKEDLWSLIKTVMDASIAEEASEIPLRARAFFWGKPGCGKSEAAKKIPEFLGLPCYETSIRSPEELSRENLEGVTRMRPDVNLGWLVEPLISKLEENPDETYNNGFLIINDFHNVLFNPQSGRAALAFLLDYLDPEKRNVKHNYFRAPINIRRTNIIITSNKSIPKGNNTQDEIYAALPSRLQEIEFPDLEEEKQREILKEHIKQLHQHNHFANWITLTYSNEDKLIINSTLLDAQTPETLHIINLTENPLMDKTNIRTRKRSLEVIVSKIADQMMCSAEDLYREAEKKLAPNMPTEDAIKLLERAAKNGKILAAYRLGKIFADRGERSQSKFWYQAAQENNNVEATLELGKIFEAEGNKSQAKMCFEKAAEKDNAESMARLGQVYENEGNNDRAEQLYRKAFNLNYPEAKRYLALLYTKKEKYIEAKTLYLELLQANLLASQVVEDLYKLGQKFEGRDRISPKNIHAMECFRRAANQGHVLSHLKIGMAPLWENMEAFDEKALASLRFAAEKNNAIALNMLGFLCLEGQGSVPKNHSEALKYFEKAKDECLLANFNLVWLYGHGSAEVQKNNELAKLRSVFFPITNEEELKTLVWTQLSNQPRGMYEAYATIIGSLHFHGWVYTKDIEKARTWYKLAAATGYVPAKGGLSVIENELNTIKKDGNCNVQ